MPPGETGALQTGHRGSWSTASAMQPRWYGCPQPGQRDPALPLLDVVPAHRAHRDRGAEQAAAVAPSGSGSTTTWTHVWRGK